LYCFDELSKYETRILIWKISTIAFQSRLPSKWWAIGCQIFVLIRTQTKNFFENVDLFAFDEIDCLRGLDLISWCDRVIKYECNNIHNWKRQTSSFISFILSHFKGFLNRLVLCSCQIAEKYHKKVNHRVFLQSNGPHWTDFKRCCKTDELFKTGIMNFH
jgi:hypothetical protein